MNNSNKYIFNQNQIKRVINFSQFSWIILKIIYLIRNNRIKAGNNRINSLRQIKISLIWYKTNKLRILMAKTPKLMKNFQNKPALKINKIRLNRSKMQCL